MARRCRALAVGWLWGGCAVPLEYGSGGPRSLRDTRQIGTSAVVTVVTVVTAAPIGRAPPRHLSFTAAPPEVDAASSDARTLWSLGGSEALRLGGLGHSAAEPVSGGRKVVTSVAPTPSSRNKTLVHWSTTLKANNWSSLRLWDACEHFGGPLGSFL
jgi:hypothetical protein